VESSSWIFQVAESFKETTLQKLAKIISPSRSVTQQYDEEVHKRRKKLPSLVIIIWNMHLATVRIYEIWPQR
jgi:hypothetical protein